jgi:hypothetical protein
MLNITLLAILRLNLLRHTLKLVVILQVVLDAVQALRVVLLVVVVRRELVNWRRCPLHLPMVLVLVVIIVAVL